VPSVLARSSYLHNFYAPGLAAYGNSELASNEEESAKMEMSQKNE
jgi:hypothetical protein